MNQQQEWRRAAAQAFIESLEQLQQTMEATDESPEAQPPDETPQPASPTIGQVNLDVWAEAIADIDQFIQKKNDLNGVEPSED